MSPAVRGLIYLQATSLYGLVRSRLLRLKQPKYLAGALIGFGYVNLFFLHRTHYAHHTLTASAVSSALVAALWSLGLLLMLLMSWLLPKGPAALSFSEPEIAFLFPAPIRRRTLVHYCLIRSQLRIVLSAVLLAVLVANRWAYLAGNPLIHALGWWLILATLTLHGTAASFLITHLARRGVPTWCTRVGVIGLVVLLAVGTGLWIRDPGLDPGPQDFISVHAMLAYLSSLSRVLTHGPLSWALALPRLVVAPFLSTGWSAFALTLAPALLVLGAHYVWALVSAVSFEEASIAGAEKRAARLKARQLGTSRLGVMPTKARRARFKLAPAGRPEIAFLWKNLLATPAFVRPGTAVIAAAAITAGCLWLAGDSEHRAMLPAVTGIALIMIGYTAILGPQLVRYDLRSDLLYADLLKSYPLKGWQIILGELLTPLTIITTVVWLALLAIALSAGAVLGFGFPLRAGLAATMAVLTPGLCALQLLTPNALAVLFPAWARAVSNRAEQGLEVAGQRLLFIGLQILATLLALVPPAAGGALAFLLVRSMAGWLPAALTSPLVALGILLAEVWGAIRWLGSCFERLDLSA